MLRATPARTTLEIALDLAGLIVFVALCSGVYGFLIHLAALVRPVLQ